MHLNKTGYTCVDERETEMQRDVAVVTVDEFTYLRSTTSKARGRVQDAGGVEMVEMIFGVICERGIATRERKTFKMEARPASRWCFEMVVLT